MVKNGRNGKFWTDNWTGMGFLKGVYTRIFALALNK